MRSSLEKLTRIPQSSYDEFAADFRNAEAALHLLQTSIHALVDMGSKACASLGLETPRTSFEVIERLEQDGRLPKGSAQRFAPIIGFRNRVVHLYDPIDPQIVHRVVTERRSDLLDLLDLLLATLTGTQPDQARCQCDRCYRCPTLPREDRRASRKRIASSAC